MEQNNSLESDAAPENLMKNNKLNSDQFPGEFVEVICNEEATKMEDRLEFLSPRPGGGCALGCSAMNGRCWSGSVWLYDDPLNAPDIAATQGSYQLQSGVPCAAWLSREVLVLGQDGGYLEWLSTTTDPGKLTCVTSTADHTAAINDIAVNCDSTRLITVSADCCVCVVDSSSRQREKLYQPAHASDVMSVSAHPAHAKLFATASLDGNVLVWDTRQPKPATGVFRNTACPVTSVLWADSSSSSSGSELGSLVMGTIDGQLLLHDTKTRETQASCADLLTRQVHRLVPCPDQPGVVAVCGNQEIVKVVNITDTTVETRYTSSQHKDLVRDLLWLDAFTLLSCGWDKQVLKHVIPSS